MLCDGLFAVILTNAIPQKINRYGESVTHCLTLQACFKSHSFKRSDERVSDYGKSLSFFHRNDDNKPFRP